jgi:hypothetical protein
LEERPVLSVSASRVAPTPLLPEPDELLLEELELEDELVLLEELEDELVLLEELEEELDELELDAVPPQAVRVPIVKHTNPALSKASRVLPEVIFRMCVTLWNGCNSSFNSSLPIQPAAANCLEYNKRRLNDKAWRGKNPYTRSHF